MEAQTAISQESETFLRQVAFEVAVEKKADMLLRFMKKHRFEESLTITWAAVILCPRSKKRDLVDALVHDVATAQRIVRMLCGKKNEVKARSIEAAADSLAALIAPTLPPEPPEPPVLDYTI